MMEKPKIEDFKYVRFNGYGWHNYSVEQDKYIENLEREVKFQDDVNTHLHRLVSAFCQCSTKRKKKEVFNFFKNVQNNGESAIKWAKAIFEMYELPE